jgi:transposase InsO family protein
VAYYASLGIAIRRLLTDNGDSYRSATFRAACTQLGIAQRFTRPYTPRTKRQSERFIQTARREWAYARAYESSQQRADQLPGGCITTTGTAPMLAWTTLPDQSFRSRPEQPVETPQAAH